ncbi:phage head-tail connector protein [Clostridium botulinum]|uniref:phage head-tail connector protein n=1 Tax=Clostridium botulinum TaxID=1491 RepID=UPI00096DC273|nr:phage head-tail connector protein [Clostridium botulinum]
MLENLKLLLDINDNKQDAKLNYIIKMCTRKILDYCDREVLINGMEDLIIEFSILRYNRLGTEGIKSEQYNEVSNNFSDNIPKDLKKQLNKYKIRRLKTL